MAEKKESDTTNQTPGQEELRKPGAKEQKKAEANPLGLSGKIYALGESALDSLLITAGTFVAFLALIHFGKNVEPIDRLRKVFYDAEFNVKNKPKVWANKLLNKNITIPSNLPGDYKNKAPVSAAGAFAWSVGHLGWISGAARAKNKVDKANAVYEEAITERDAALKRADTAEGKLAQYEGVSSQAKGQESPTPPATEAQPQSQVNKLDRNPKNAMEHAEREPALAGIRV